MKTMKQHPDRNWRYRNGMALRNSALLVVISFLVGTASAIGATADPPSGISYQGYVTEGTDGTPIGKTGPENVEIEFRIWNLIEEGTIADENLIWSEVQTVTVDNGSFSVMLGEGSPIDGEDDQNSIGIAGVFDAADASDRYVELTVDSSTISPRLRLVTSPYSFLASKAISADKLSSDSIDAITIDGVDKVTIELALDVSGGTKISNALEVTGDVTVGETVSATSFTGGGTIPVGGIIMWSGSTSSIPSGWAICNGNNGTPDLRSRFVVGAGDDYSVGDTGGSNTRSLSSSNLPSFDITYNDIFYSESSGGSSGSATTTGVPNNFGSNGGYDNDNVGYQKSRTASYSGSASSFNIRPPYYALAYIMRTE